MPGFRVTRKAQADLIAIGRFTEREWGRNQRKSYLKQLDNSFGKIAENPELGTACDYIKTGYRKLPQGSHLIFYRLGAMGMVEIVRVLHKSMDVGSKL